ncbi:MAG: isoprenylcysteine carboxylmethyltransferase family protein [Acidobacteria bacterium]|nr:MAG: isoprenylcysteine carboxylmethyltransferase family protein [Acidobacteriota bacterium]
MQLRPVPFSGGLIQAAVFWIAFALWLLPEIIASIFKRSAASAQARDRGSLALIALLWWVGILSGFLISFLLPKTAIHWERTLVFLASICLMIAGTAFRWYSARLLGKYFTFDVATQGGQVLIECGPYRYVRHPSYSGALVSLLGFGLALGNWAALIASVSCLSAAYAYRIPVEEAALSAALGEPYRQYMRRTWRLVPFLF